MCRLCEEPEPHTCRMTPFMTSYDGISYDICTICDCVEEHKKMKG